MPSSFVEVEAVPREGLLSRWAPVIVTNIVLEEIVSVGYNHEKLLERTDLFPDVVIYIYRARLTADFNLGHF